MESSNPICYLEAEHIDETGKSAQCTHEQCLKLAELKGKMLTLNRKVSEKNCVITFYNRANPEQIREMNKLLNEIADIEYECYERF